MRNQLKAGVILSYMISATQVVVQLLYTPVMLKLLGQSEYGLYTLVGSVVSYLTLCGLGFSGAYLRFFSRYRIKDDLYGIAKLNGTFLTVYSILAIVVLAVGSILVNGCGELLGDKIQAAEIKTAKILMAILVANIAISFINTIFDSIIIAHEAYIFQRIVRLASVVANPLLALPLLLLGYKSVALVAVTTMLSIVTLFINIFYCKKMLCVEFKLGLCEWTLMKEIGAFSFFVFLNMIIDQINWNVDKLLLGRFCGTMAVAVYGIGAQLNNIDINISLSVSSVFAPRVNQMSASKCNNSVFTELFIKTGRIQCMIMLLLDSGLLFFGKPFIYLWAGAEYKDAYYVMLCLVLPAFIPCIQNIGLEIQRAKNQHQFRTVAYLVMSIINVIISIPLSRQCGPIGAAIGTTISLLIGNGIIMNWYYHKKIGIDIVLFWKSMVSFTPTIIISFVVGVMIVTMTNLYSWKSLFLFEGLYSCVYCLVLWIFGMNKAEKKLVLSIVGSMKK